MKKLVLILCIIFFAQEHSFAQTKFVLEPSQSMSITGKGPGQDAAINPFYGQDCFAIVENIGKSEFTIRVQQNGKIIETLAVKKGKKLRVKLLKGYELYFDADAINKGKANVKFEKMNE